MRRMYRAAAAALALAAPGQLRALPLPEPPPRNHWECVPFARAVSGIRIYGDAWTWWEQAAGRYPRGNAPRIGAVLAFIPHGRMELGHVAAVSEIVDSRTLRITHANWSPIDGRRGQVERDVTVIDVSPANDWTAVRVWFSPSQALGGTAWPTHGFIYPKGEAPTPSSPGAAPKLQFADVLKWTAKLPAAARSEEPRPTGRLAYLARDLRRLR